LLGVCTEQEPFLMIMELMARGDLKTVLRDSRPKVRVCLRVSVSVSVSVSVAVVLAAVG
jgi:hypothetical protein